MRFWQLLSPSLGLVAVLLAASADSAAAAPTINSPDTANDVGRHSALVLDATGSPVVAYWYVTASDLRILHCNDPACAPGGDSITTPDSSGLVGETPSLVLDAAGNPVVSYYDRTQADLNILHCNDPNCAGGDESITSSFAPGSDGEFSSIALDSGGNPIVAATYGFAGTLRIMNCNDPNCAGGDETFNSFACGEPSLELDGVGYPVVACGNKLLHCNDASCAGGDDVLATNGLDAGGVSSMALDGAGNPVIAQSDSGCCLLGSVKVVHCNDSGCAGGDDVPSTLDSMRNGYVGDAPEVAVDGSGNPIVSYHSSTLDALVVAHCNDTGCVGGDEGVSQQEVSGGNGFSGSLVLDSSGNPVVSFFDSGTDDLKLLRCDSVGCVSGVGGVASLAAVERSSRGLPVAMMVTLSSLALIATTAAVVLRRRRA